MSEKQYEAAEKKYKEVVRIYEDQLGIYHEDTLSAKHNYGLLLQNLKKYQEAKEIQDEVLEGCTD